MLRRKDKKLNPGRFEAALRRCFGLANEGLSPRNVAYLLGVSESIVYPILRRQRYVKDIKRLGLVLTDKNNICRQKIHNHIAFGKLSPMVIDGCVKAINTSNTIEEAFEKLESSCEECYQYKKEYLLFIVDRLWEVMRYQDALMCDITRKSIAKQREENNAYKSS